MWQPVFLDRQDAGARLGKLLAAQLSEVDEVPVTIISIPRGGVVVGAVVATELKCPHEVLVVKKLTMPMNPEMSFGALAEDGQPVINQHLMNKYGVDMNDFRKEVRGTRELVNRYVNMFRQGKPLNMKPGTLVVVDDGVATGETMRAAVVYLRDRRRHMETGGRLVVAVPVITKQALNRLRSLADEVFCLNEVHEMQSVSHHYISFPQVSDGEVIRLLHETYSRPGESRARI